MRTVAGVALLVLLAASIVSARQGAGLQWWITHATVKTRPLDRPPATLVHEAAMHAARNEFEAFQIVLRSTDRVDAVDVEVSDLVDSAGRKIPAKFIQTYFVETLPVEKPSRASGTIGDWPDPLIPRVDPYYQERRRAFPFTLTAGRNQAVWIDVYVPRGTPAGAYRGRATISVNRGIAIEAPIQLEVWDFELPSTSSLATTFGFSGISALKQHAGRYTSDNELLSLSNLYARAALLNRISLHGGSMIPPPFTLNQGNTAAVIDWKDYDREIGVFLDGTALGASGPLPGARYTSIDLRTPVSANTDAEKVLYWKEWARHFRERGWIDRLFYYVRDEPAVKDFPEIVRLSNLAHKADPAIRTLVTTSQTQALSGAIDIWAPLINCLELKPGFDSFCRETVGLSSYARDLREGRKLWWYQSCGSHGCNIPGSRYFDGWPSYVVDDTAVSNRVMPWLAWKYGISGELYYNVNEAYGHPTDPWSSLYLFGGNGDGTLLDPGRVARIGGNRDIPIESMRLKLIREGLEDYEYFRLLGPAADDHVGRIVQRLFRFNADPEALYAERTSMGNAIAKRVKESALERGVSNGGTRENR